jgi:hypothetical protein
MAARKAKTRTRASGAARTPILFTALSANDRKTLRAAKATAAQRFLRAPEATAFTAMSFATSPAPSHNVVGVGIGEKISAGKNTGVLAIKFLVRIKYPDNQIPDSERLPTELEGHPVDVEQTGTLRKFMPPSAAMPDPRKKIRPAQPGCSVGFKDPGGKFIMAGTFGALVSKGTKRFVLSNNHVLADENKLAVGASIFQPGFLDAGNPPNNGAIAKLTKFVPLVFGGGMNTVDCALAELNTSQSATKSVLFIGAPTGKTKAAIDMVVHKFGRTTGFTAGRVTSIETDVNIQYEGGNASFENQIIIVGLNSQPFSASGDSGSLILERSTNKAVGLLFAGSSTHTIANHIGDVLTALKVTLTV